MTAIILSCIAIVVAIIAAGFTGKQAMAVTSDDHRKRAPKYEVTMRSAASNQQTIAIYNLKMVSDQPIDCVSIPQPSVRIADGRIFPLSITGQSIPKEGIVNFGPLRIGDSERPAPTNEAVSIAASLGLESTHYQTLASSQTRTNSGIYIGGALPCCRHFIRLSEYSPANWAK